MEPGILPLALFDVALQALAVLAVVVVVVLAVRTVLFVDENERHVLLDADGDAEAVLDTGIHYISPLRPGGRTVEVSPVSFQLAGGRAETDDGVVVTADLVGEFEVVDAAALVEGTRSHPRDVQNRIDEAYVTQVESLTWEELSTEPAALAEACRGELERALERWGVELRRLEVERVERVE